MQCPSCGADDKTCACALVHTAQHGTPAWPVTGHVNGTAPCANGTAITNGGLAPGPEANDLLQFLRDFTSVTPAGAGGREVNGTKATEAPPGWGAVLTPAPPPPAR